MGVKDFGREREPPGPGQNKLNGRMNCWKIWAIEDHSGYTRHKYTVYKKCHNNNKQSCLTFESVFPCRIFKMYG